MNPPPVRPITPTVTRANGSKAGACDGRDSSGWSGSKTLCSVRGAAVLCGSSRSSPTEPLSTGYSGTSGSSTPTLRRCAIIPRPGPAGHLSGEPRTPREPPLCPLGAGRSISGRGHRPRILSLSSVHLSPPAPDSPSGDHPGNSMTPNPRSNTRKHARSGQPRLLTRIRMPTVSRRPSPSR